jgi:hypothetical protein
MTITFPSLYLLLIIKGGYPVHAKHKEYMTEKKIIFYKNMKKQQNFFVSFVPFDRDGLGSNHRERTLNYFRICLKGKHTSTECPHRHGSISGMVWLQLSPVQGGGDIFSFPSLNTTCHHTC